MRVGEPVKNIACRRRSGPSFSVAIVIASTVHQSHCLWWGSVLNNGAKATLAAHQPLPLDMERVVLRCAAQHARVIGKQ